MKGYPTVCDHFERKQEALDWSYETTRQIKLGKSNFRKQNQKKTVADLNEMAFIEHLFPKKMDLHYGKITKLVQPQLYPVSKEVVAMVRLLINSDVLLILIFAHGQFLKEKSQAIL